MKHDSGIKDRDDKSIDTEILMAEGFAKIFLRNFVGQRRNFTVNVQE